MQTGQTRNWIAKWHERKSGLLDQLVVDGPITREHVFLHFPSVLPSYGNFHKELQTFFVVFIK